MPHRSRASSGGQTPAGASTGAPTIERSRRCQDRISWPSVSASGRTAAASATHGRTPAALPPVGREWPSRSASRPTRSVSQRFRRRPARRTPGTVTVGSPCRAAPDGAATDSAPESGTSSIQRSMSPSASAIRSAQPLVGLRGRGRAVDVARQVLSHQTGRRGGRARRGPHRSRPSAPQRDATRHCTGQARGVGVR